MVDETSKLTWILNDKGYGGGGFPNGMRITEDGSPRIIEGLSGNTNYRIVEDASA